MSAEVSARARPPAPSATPDAAPPAVALTAKDFASDQEVRWCPGCGDYAILKTIQQLMPELGIPRERIVFVSGIGCAAPVPVLHGHVRDAHHPTGAPPRSRPG